jgi:hypothetical protein
MIAGGETENHQIPGYTGFLPGGQHQMAKTYGQASAAALKERQANDDPLKWRKHVSYAEFTPAHTPNEGHHVPGYSGHVPAVYAENLYAKTYGKTTLKAVAGDFPKGCEQMPSEQYKTSNQEMMGSDIPHPGRPTDITPGGASWSGASPYNVEEVHFLEAVNPWPPSVVQIAGGKEPTQTSIILKNFPPTGESKEPALRITPKSNPHELTAPDKKTMSYTDGQFKIPGYSGFVPGVQAENMYGKTYGHSSHMAIAGDHKRFQWREQTAEERFASSSGGEMIAFGHPAKIEDGHVTYAHEVSNPAQANYKKTPKKIFHVANDQLPGYGGFVPNVQSKNMYGKTQYIATSEALAMHYKKHAEYDEKKPKTAPVGSPETAGLGMLQFKPNGFLYQKRMQGEWNNGMLGSRNYSAVRLSEGRHWKGNLYTTTNKELHLGHSNEDVPVTFSKGPEPLFENMGHALKHKSCYLGFMAL